jgi:plastocyanin
MSKENVQKFFVGLTLALGVIIPGIYLATSNNEAEQDTSTDTVNEATDTNTSDPATSGPADDTSMFNPDAPDRVENSQYDYMIDMTNYAYSIEEIQAEPGETINILLNSEEGTHDFVIDELDVDSGIVNAGGQTELTFSIPEDAEAGTSYEYYCSVGNHRQLGQVGTLVIN